MNDKKELYTISKARLLVIWFSITAISFILSEFGCLYDGLQGVISLLRDYKGLIVDGISCALFSAVCIVCSYSFIRKREHNSKMKKIPFAAVGIIILLLNFFISLIIDMAYDNIFPSYAYQYFIDDVYDSCLLSSLCSFVVIMHFYGQKLSFYEREKKLATIKLLKFQMNPHFVFNSLNILVGLINMNPKKAGEFAIRLSKIYRYITKSIGKELVSIDDSFSYAKDYFAILQMRYPDSIDYEIKRSSNGFIVPMALQVMIENAVKHNIPTPTNKLSVSLECNSDYVVVSNNIIRGTSYSGTASSAGVGLSNIFDQYSLMWNKSPVLKCKDGYFRVYLPIIKQSERYE